MKRTSLSLAASFLLALPSADGSLLSPGQTVTGMGSSFDLSSAVLVAFQPATAASNGVLNVSYAEAVVSDTNNTFCAGCLDFVIGVQNNSTADSGESIESLTTGSFAGFLTDVGVVSGTSGVAPSSIFRNSFGTVVKFDFGGSGDILPGGISDDLVIETNATSFVPGRISIQDDISVDVAGFAPAPEPVSMALLGGGLALLGLTGIRRRAKKQAAKK